MTAAPLHRPLSALPDPARRPDFYRGTAVKRALAWVVDVFLIGTVCVLLLPFTAFTGIFFFSAMMLVVGFFYRWFTIASRSATWGMRLMAIELRDHEGQRFDSSMALWHTAGYTVSVIMAPAQFVSALLMLATPRGQGLSDLVLGTTAINRPG